MVYIGVFLALFIGKYLFLFLMPRFGWWFSWWLVLLLQKWCAIKGVFGPVHWQKFVLIFLIWMVERSGDSLIPRKLYDVSLLLPERFHRRTSWLGVKRVTSALQRVQSRGGLWLGLAGWALSLMGSEHWRCYYWWPQCAYYFYATKIMIIFQKKSRWWKYHHYAVPCLVWYVAAFATGILHFCWFSLSLLLFFIFEIMWWWSVNLVLSFKWLPGR